MTDSAHARSLIPDNYMKFGIFLAPFHPMGENPTMTMERDMQLLEHLDMLGYHEAWVGEHHSGGYELIACPEMFIAGAAERTKTYPAGYRRRVAALSPSFHGRGPDGANWIT